MDVSTKLQWHAKLLDPTGQRSLKPRSKGKTMIIDKGIGLRAFEDMLAIAGDHIDIIKVGFGTSPLYPQNILRQKIELAKSHDICILPGGTFLELAIAQKAEEHFFDTIALLGFTGIEVSDGTIELDRIQRNEMIVQGVQSGFTVFSEYGKKKKGSTVDMEDLLYTVQLDIAYGAALVTIEGRESGVGVGIYDDQGDCKEEDLQKIIDMLPDPYQLMWEAPLKPQQVYLMKRLGADINLGNIAPEDVLSLEALRRGLRSDTMPEFTVN